MALRRIGRKWYAYFKVAGRYKVIALKTDDKSIAERRESAVKVELDYKRFLASLRRDDAVTTPITAERPRCALESLYGIASKRRTLTRFHEQAWRHFVAHVPCKDAHDVTAKVCQDYLDRFYGSSKAKTYNNHRSQLSTIFRLAMVDAGLTVNPWELVTVRIVNDATGHRNLSAEEIRRIMESDRVSLGVKTMVMLARWTAQRLETVYRITPAMVDRQRGCIVVQPGKTARFGKWCCIPLFPPLLQWLDRIEDCPDDKPYSEHFGLVGECRFGSYFVEKVLRPLGINDTADGKASFHSLRGTAITWLKEAGIPEDIRRDITGHTSRSMEDVYARAVRTVSSLDLSHIAVWQ